MTYASVRGITEKALARYSMLVLTWVAAWKALEAIMGARAARHNLEMQKPQSRGWCLLRPLRGRIGGGWRASLSLPSFPRYPP